MGLNQPLAGQVEPDARSWRSASAADRLAFYKKAGELAEFEKLRELARAIGANGRRMKPRKHPRPDGADGPVMTPHEDESRTARLLDSRAWTAGVTLFWHAGLRKGQRTPWGSILAFHARGAGRLPVRDVRLSRRGIRAVRSQMASWWTDHLRRKPVSGRGASQKKTGNRKSIVKKLQERLVARYRGLKDYFRSPDEGF